MPFGRLPGHRIEVAARRRFAGGRAPRGERGSVVVGRSRHRRADIAAEATIIRGRGGDNPRMPKPVVSLVASVARDGGIGHAGGLLGAPARRPAAAEAADDGRADRHGPQDLGFAAPPAAARPAQHRRHARPGVARRGRERAASLEAALALAGEVPRIFVLGGAEIFARALPLADELELTEIDAEFPADTFFPPWNRAEFRQTSREAHVTPEGLVYQFATYRRTTPGE
jgi:dihydrofolate reductase